jgi:aminoglycoside 6'-N-acetyltransferase
MVGCRSRLEPDSREGGGVPTPMGLGMNVRLEPFDWGSHAALLGDWLQRPHVLRWWLDPERALAEAAGLPPESQAMIVEGGRPVGYLRWEPPPPEGLAAAGLSDLPDHLVDIDIMIGEPEALGRGVGPRALGLLLDRFRADPRVEWAGLGTSLANERAIRAFEKAGFQRFREIADPEIGPGLYLVKDLRPDHERRRDMADNDFRPDPDGRRNLVLEDLPPGS